MCESQSEKAFNEKLARSQWISKQAYQTKLRPMPPVVLSQEIGLSPEGQRERKNYFTAALCLGIPGVIMLLSPFILGYIIAGVPGDHGINGDGWDLRAFGAFITITPIGVVVSYISVAMMGLGAMVKE